MKDVSKKTASLRVARAQATLHCFPATVAAIRAGNVPKADPLATAKVAAVQAAKNTSLIIPYCHQVPLDFVGVDVELRESSIHIYTEVKAIWKTGVEMEALVAAGAAVLTLYDMLKPIDEGMEIGSVKLTEKKGGKSDFKVADLSRFRCAVIVASDRAARGEREDTSGKTIKERLESLGVAVVEYTIVQDEMALVRNELIRLCDEVAVDLILTTGGTGVGPRDVTPEATQEILDRPLPGVSEFLRSHGQQRTQYSMLSRGTAGVRKKTVVINLPGAPAAVHESLDALLPWVFHVFPMMKGEQHEEGFNHSGRG